MRPTRRLLALLGAWLVLALFASAIGPLTHLWVGTGMALLGTLVLEWVALARTPAPACVRSGSFTLAVGVWSEVTLRLASRSRRFLSIEVTDHPPASFAVEALPRRLRLAPAGWAQVPYRVRPTRRGCVHFGQADLLLSGPLGLLERRVRVGEPQQARVYPDFQAVSRYALLALNDRLSQIGIAPRRRRGQGTEFFQLREYRRGDPIRQIDWKAVSRRHELISRDYREEQSQRVLFLLDCGRRMHSRDGELSLFDHALNAMLLLAYVATRQGDAAGLMTFSGHDRWLPPARGRRQLTRMLNAVFDLHSTTAPSDYAEAARRLGLRQRRRALVVMMTNIRDDDTSDLFGVLAPLRRRHLVLLASLREPVLGQALTTPIGDLGDATRVAAAYGYLEARRRAHEAIRAQGVIALDEEPADLPVALVNRYLAIKRAGML